MNILNTKTNKHILHFLPIFFISFGIHAQSLTVHTCSTNSDVKTCANGYGCKSISSTVNFTVDKSINAILRKWYAKDGSISSTILRNCRIFSKSDWECLDGDNSDSMFDGIYMHTNQNPVLRNSYYDLSKGSPFYCAK
jgi:hypothetical protein